MMQRPARLALQKRIRDAENALEADLIHDADRTDLQRHDLLLQMLDRLHQQFPAKKPPVWLMPLSVAMLALSLLGMAAAIRVSEPVVALDARLSAVSITTASDDAGLSSDSSMAVTSLEIAGDAKAHAIAESATSIASLKLRAGTTVLMQQRASCLEIQIPVTQNVAKSGAAPGLDLVTLRATLSPGQLPSPTELYVAPGTAATICGSFPATYSLSGTISRIGLYRSHPGDALRGFVSWRTPSIASGKLRLPQVNGVSDLQDTDMLSFEGISKGWTVVFPAPTMRIAFSGKVDRAMRIFPTLEGESSSLAPTWLDWLTKSPLTTAVFGLVTGLVGMLWGLAKYFGYSAL